MAYMFFRILILEKRAREKGMFNGREIHLSSKRRNGFDITRDILQVCVKGANKTHIVYAANLNSKRTNNYLEFCLNMHFLNKQHNGGHFVYNTTTEGVHFMKNYFGAPQLQHVTQIR
jgi:predicted transcriptional regulator